MKYLVTDPCYTIKSHEQWVALLDEHGYDEWNERIKCDIGIIIVASGTTNGDGSIRVSGHKVVNADAGMTCIVELDENGPYNEHAHGNAVTDSLQVAQNWFAKAQTI